MKVRIPSSAHEWVLEDQVVTGTKRDRLHAETDHVDDFENFFRSPPRWHAKTSEEHQGSVDYCKLNKTRMSPAS